MKHLMRIALTACVCLGVALLVMLDRSPGYDLEPFRPQSVTRCEHLWSEVCRLNEEMVAVGNAGQVASGFTTQADRTDSLAIEITEATARYMCECSAE